MQRRFGLILCWLILCLGCTETIPEDDEILLSTPADPVGDKQRGVACNQRWQAPTHVHAARAVVHQRAHPECAGRAQNGAKRFGDFIKAHFGEEIDTDVPGDGIQIYNCRRVRGGRSNSVHGDGRAVDIFIPTRRGGVADNAKGDRIANWLATNAAYIGIQYIIWDRTSFKGSREAQSKCYTGAHPHNDHIHVELTWAAAREETPFFRQDQRASPAPAPSSTPAPSSESEPSSSPTFHDHAEETDHGVSRESAADNPYETSGRAWLGEPCNRDSHCIQTAEVPASCLVPDGANSGFCTVSCDGICPDRTGHSQTFCAAANMMGFGAIGLCMAKSSTQNGYCAAWPAFDSFEVRRYVNQSQASARNAVVCAAAPARNIATEDAETTNSNSLCDDPLLPLSDHGRACADAGENEWRCACSERYQTTVSQVCRNGQWTNYELNPSDCGRCDGRYSSGCEPN